MRIVTIVLVLVGCSGANDELDAGELLVDGGQDDRDAGEDAGRLPDAGRDVDAGELDAGRLTDAGSADAGPVCDLVEQTGCPVGQACRRGPGGPFSSPRSGPPRCEEAGTLQEWINTPDGCRDDEGEDRCRAGLFCQPFGVCVRYCEIGGEPCPDTPNGSTQTCIEGAALDPYCTPFAEP